MYTALYIRVSSHEQAIHGNSLQAQESRLRAFCEAKDLSNIKVYIDDGYSGASLKRPQMDKLIQDVKEDVIDTVIVYKLDRLSRSQKDTLHLIEDIFNTNNTALISVSESFDTSTAFGRAMVGMLSVFAQLERENIRERMMMGKTEIIKKGKYPGGYNNVPFGYRVVDGQYIQDDYEVMILKDIYSRFMNGISAYKILNDISREYNTPIKSHDRLLYILKNPFYYGMKRFSGDIYEGSHEPVITEKDFQAVQMLLQKRNEKQSKHDTSHLYLKGLVKCGNCGASYITNRGWTNKEGVTTYYYACSSKTHKYRLPPEKQCNQRSIRAEELHKFVLSDVEKIRSGGFQIDKPDDSVGNVDIIKKRMSEIDRKIEKLMDLYLSETIDKTLLKNRTHGLYVEKSELELKLAEYKPKKEISKTALEQFKGSDINKMSNERIRALLALIIDRITFFDDRIEITYNHS